MPKVYNIFILPNGDLRFVYYDELKPLLKIGKNKIKRVSYVEPVIVKDDVQWFADLKLVNGPKLGPFTTRKKALNAELKWLGANLYKILEN